MAKVRFMVEERSGRSSLFGGIFQRQFVSEREFFSPLEALHALKEEKELLRNRAVALFLIDRNCRKCSPDLI